MCLAVIGMEEIPQEEDGSEKLFLCAVNDVLP